MCIRENQPTLALLSLLCVVYCGCRRWWRLWWRCSLCLGLSSWWRLSDGLSATNLGQRALFVRTPQQLAVLSAARLACRGVLCCSGWGPQLWGLCYRKQGACASGLLLLCCVSAQRGAGPGAAQGGRIQEGGRGSLLHGCACACMGLGAAQRARVRTTAHHTVFTVFFVVRRVHCYFSESRLLVCE